MSSLYASGWKCQEQCGLKGWVLLGKKWLILVNLALENEQRNPREQADVSSGLSVFHGWLI